MKAIMVSIGKNLILVMALLSVSVQAPAQDGGAVSPGVARAFNDAGLPLLRQRAVPEEFSAALPDGTTRSLSSLRGKVVFLNFWATWCGPCRQEMPSMETLYRRFRDQGLEILALNCRERAKDVTAFMRNGGFSFESALDSSGRISERYGITAIPTTFIIDREGRIITKVVGSLNWNNPRIIAAFEALLDS